MVGLTFKLATTLSSLVCKAIWSSVRQRRTCNTPSFHKCRKKTVNDDSFRILILVRYMFRLRYTAIIRQKVTRKYQL